MENRISISIPDAVVTEFLSKISEATDIIKPYMASVTSEQRKSLLKLADKTLPLVQKSLDYARNTGKDYTPVYLDITEFEKDVTSSSKIDVMYKAAEQVANMLDDTYALTANDSYAEALVYYNAVKNAAKSGESKAKTIYEDLSQRFPGRSSSKTETITSSK